MKGTARSWSPLVSVITPSFNQGGFIEDTLRSVRSQDYANIEHIVVDGGSTDSTVEMLREYQHTYNLRWSSEPDDGHADAVNKGFRMARGEVIGWLNSDDAYFDVSAVSTAVKVLQDRPGIDVVYGDIVYTSEDNTVLLVRCVPHLFSYRRLLLACFLAQPAVFLRRKVTEEHQLDTSTRFAVDYEYWLRIGQQHRFAHIDRILAADRCHASRRLITGADRVRAEAREAQGRHGQSHNLIFYLARFADRAFTGIPRRIRGAFLLPTLYHKRDFAFDLKLEPLWRTLARQLFTWSYRGLTW